MAYSMVLPPTGHGRPRRLYHLTEDGRQAHLGWVREPVAPDSVSQDLGLHRASPAWAEQAIAKLAADARQR